MIEAIEMALGEGGKLCYGLGSAEGNYEVHRIGIKEERNESLCNYEGIQGTCDEEVWPT